MYLHQWSKQPNNGGGMLLTASRNKMQRISNKQQGGFSLLEIMITVIIANIALLGLVAAEVKSLQYANNSFQYTVSLVQANNVVERVLNDVCNLKSGTSFFDETYVNTTLAPINGYSLTLPDLTPASSISAFTEQFIVNVGWVDKRMTDQQLNQVAVQAYFPVVESGCSVDG